MHDGSSPTVPLPEPASQTCGYLVSCLVDSLSIEGFNNQFRKDYENLDLSLRYDVTERLTVFADFNNLTDEKYIAYSGSVARPTEVEQIGRRYLFGLRLAY